MLDAVKKYVDEGNIEDLKYIFVDALDLNPDFGEYREDFEYVKRHNMFDDHKDLTELKDNPAEWDGLYWIRLKKDLQKNFSRRRMEHMIEVAKVLFADEIKKARAARGETAAETTTPTQPAEMYVAAEVATEKQQTENEKAALVPQDNVSRDHVAQASVDNRHSLAVEQTKPRIIATTGLAKQMANKKKSGVSWGLIAALLLVAVLAAILIFILK